MFLELEKETRLKVNVDSKSLPEQALTPVPIVHRVSEVDITSKETNDYESDMKFGNWLRDQRLGAGLTLEQAAERSGLSSRRLRSLELGYAEKGITKTESEKICEVYKIVLKDFLTRASGEDR